MTTIYHNPRCSKSRATLALLRERGVEPTVVEYLKMPPDAQTLKSIVAMLGGDVRDLVRSGEEVYRELGLQDKRLSDDALVDVVVAHPQLLQRPIVVNDGRAAVGRPPELVLEVVGARTR